MAILKGWETRNLLIKVYLSSVEGPNRRGRPLGRWEDRVKEHMSERGVRENGLEWARRECMDWERWRSICRGHPLGGRFWRERGVGAIDSLINCCLYNVTTTEVKGKATYTNTCKNNEEAETKYKS